MGQDDNHMAGGNVGRRAVQAHMHVKDRQNQTAQIDDPAHRGGNIGQARGHGPTLDLAYGHDIDAKTFLADHEGKILPWRRHSGRRGQR